MKHILRKLHIGGNHDSFEGRGHDVGGRVLDGRAADVGGRVLEGRGHDVGALNTGETSTHSDTHSSLTSCGADQRGLSGISGWLNNARHSLLPSNATRSRFDGSGGAAGNSEAPRLASVPGTSDSELDFKFYEEEYQVQLALALSVSNNDVLDDPESLQIRAAKRISLGRPPSPGNSPSEFISNRYWNYNVLDYDEKVVDGFYDVYGVISDFGASEKMPSLVDLQGTPVSNNLGYEVVLVNRGLDPDLVQLEQAALYLAVECGANEFGSRQGGLAQKIADLVVGHMGGPVIDASEMLMRWQARSYELRTSLNNIVLPLGCLQIGFSRHRALLFKVLADHVGIPCRLVKGIHYTGTDEGAVNIIKVDNDREYIIDLMGAPGTLLPAEIVGMTSQLEQVENAFPTPFDAESSMADTSGWQNLTGNQTKGFCNKNGETDRLSPNGNTGNGLFAAQESTMDFAILEGLPTGNTEGKPAVEGASPPNLQPQQGQLRRLNSWTGVGSPAFQMKVKDVSQYMMDAAKDNPQLAQRLHDVLLESGVIAPPDLFGDIQQQQLQVQRTDEKVLVEDGEAEGESKYSLTYGDKSNVVPGWPAGSAVRESAEASEIGADGTSYNLLSVEGVRPSHSPDPFSFVTISWSPTLAIPTAAVLNAVQETISPEIMKRVPVAAAAAATAAAVASSMVAAAAAISDSDSSFEVPAAATATAMTAVVVATPAAIKSVSKGNELSNKSPSEKDAHFNQRFQNTDFGDKMYPSTDNVGVRKDCVHSADEEIISEDQIHVRLADHSNTKADNVLDDVAEWEIPWEEIVIGDRIGLGSYGEVYHGDWHGTEVAVKKFLDQGLSGDALDEFISEVRIMRRMRHPNVVLFMGAVTRPPNLSIVTEYLPRGSLFRLLHRPNILIDEKRRLKMALDVAKGMNYLHTSTPIIVHRDLKSPNLLVDKNWVVKVCDFGLSRLKHHTFLSSKSTAGTPEWMAPEVLRNEPSNEKCDVYSFGVILWELATLRQPWSGMNPMQVVGAVGFQNRRLEIPENLDPYVARIIHQCWQNDPRLRPSFSELMAWIKPLQRLIVPRQLGTPGAAYPL